MMSVSSGAPRAFSTGHAPQVAVVGGGMAGAMCTSILTSRGANVTVFDMGRVAPGGRLTSRLTPEGHQFDAGGQFFRASGPAMRSRVREWLQAGAVAEWRPVLGVYDTSSGAFRRREELSAEQRAAAGAGFFDVLSADAVSPLYVGAPSMGALLAHMLAPRGQPAAEAGRGGEEAGAGAAGAAAPQLRLGTKVHTARFSEGRWWLEGAPAQASGAAPSAAAEAPAGGPPLGCFDALVLADSAVARAGSPGHVTFQGGSGGPPPAALSDFLSRLAAVPRTPLLTLMLAWADGPTHGSLLPGGAQAALLQGGPDTAFAWMAADSSKPGRPQTPGLTRWVAVTRPDFAAELLRRRDAAAAAAGASSGGGGGGLPPQDAAYRAGLAEALWEALKRDLRAAAPAGSPDLPAPVHLSAQRWGAGLPAAPLGLPAAWEDAGRWAACGDFCSGAGVEAAAESGAAAAEAVAAMLGLPGHVAK